MDASNRAKSYQKEVGDVNLTCEASLYGYVVYLLSTMVVAARFQTMEFSFEFRSWRQQERSIARRTAVVRRTRATQRVLGISYPTREEHDTMSHICGFEF